ncbi:MAG TPA: hypothetical protein VF450_14735 [Noviherbaspirillum sp.]
MEQSFRDYFMTPFHTENLTGSYGLLEVAGFDLPLAGAALLGHDSRVILHDDSLTALLAILADPRKRDRLIVHMTRSAGIESDTADKLLSQFELGLRD